MTFWDHLDQLRSSLLRMAAAVTVVAVVLFCFKDVLFDVVLAPARTDFFSYRLIGAEPYNVQLINTELTRQFVVHMHMAIYGSLLFTFPYLLYELFRFIAPGLYENERRYVRVAATGGTVMFLVGVAMTYCLIFPVSLRFLATYQVSADVPNIITLDSYTDTLLSLSMMLGIVCELPVVLWLAGRMGLVRRSLLQRYRRHVIVALLVVAAIITPTTDALTLIVVTLPLIGLYELSIWLVPRGGQ